MIRMFIALLILGGGSVAVGQNAASDVSVFAFKGNYLGMTLYDFKVANRLGTVSIDDDDNFVSMLAGSRSKQINIPLCSDEHHGFLGDDGKELPGEIVCNASPGDANPQGLMVGGIRASSVIYKFNAQRLYMIEVFILPSNYGEVSKLFIEKFGDPDRRSSEAFENGFGATWNGELLHWSRGKQTLSAAEGSGNGPGSDGSSGLKHSLFLFLDTANLPVKPRSALNF